MKRNKKFAFLSWVLAFILALGLWALGLLCADAIPHAFALSLIIIFLIPITYLINFFGSKRFIGKINALPTAQKIAMVTEKQKDAESDLQAVILKRHKTCVKVKIYLAFILLLTALMCFLCGAANNDHSPTVQLLLALYIFQDMLYPLFTMNRLEEEDDSGYVAEADFPCIYAMAREAAEACNVKCGIKVYIIPGAAAAIGLVGNNAVLNVGAILLDLFSEEEFRQVLLHEFGHLSDDYASYRMECESLLRYLDLDSAGSVTAVGKILMLLPCNRLAFENGLVNAVSSREAEKRADNTVLRCGKPEAFVSGLAKLSTYDYFDDYSFALPPYYEPEEPRSDTLRMLCDAYRKEFELNREQWMYMLEHELPARLDSHPSFPQRREAVGNCDFTIEFSDHDTPYRRECHKLMDVANELISQSVNPEEYKESRKQSYLYPLSVIEDYEGSKEDLSSEELSPVLNAYRDLNRFDKAEELCDRIIATEKNPYATAHALFLKGNLLLRRYDASGIELLYKAAELNENYMETGMDAVGKFCLRMGLAEELQRYRDTVDSYVEKGGVDEYREIGRLTAKDKLVAEKFPDDRLPDMLDFMVKACKDTIDEIYLVRKIINEEVFTSVFVLKFRENMDADTVLKGYEAIFNYLDTYPDGWQFTLLEYDNEIAKALKKVPEALVYKKA